MIEIKNSDELPASFVIFCKCGHGLSMHSEPRELNNYNYIDSICRFDNGHYVCPCDGFQSEAQTEKITRLSNGKDSMEVKRL